ncbi:sugar transporter protein [Rutstroemia sp. NJR-2017a BBW]|nr:sugar transporter protein [Rutstroemia sp. NJR-2017a BBW]
MSAIYGGTQNKVGNAFGIFFIFLYLAFQGSSRWRSDPSEWDSHFLANLQTAPIGFVNVGWKYYFVIIAWCIFFIPSKSTFASMTINVANKACKSCLSLLSRNCFINIRRNSHGFWR